MGSVRASLIISVALMTAVSGCGRGPFEVKVDKIKVDGSQKLADVEQIMGGKGTEIPNSALSKEDDAKTGKVFTSIADQLKGNRKLAKPGSSALAELTVPDENGTEVKWIRWDHE